MVSRDSRQHELIRFNGNRFLAVRAVHREVTGDTAGFICRKPNGDHLVRKGGEHFPFVVYSVYFITYRSQRIFDVEVAIVAGKAFMTRKIDEQVPHGLKGHPMIWRADVIVCQLLCLGIFTFNDQPPYLRDYFPGSGTDVVARLTCPNGFFVELKFFPGWVTVDHGAQASVAYR